MPNNTNFTLQKKKEPCIYHRLRWISLCRKKRTIYFSPIRWISLCRKKRTIYFSPIRRISLCRKKRTIYFSPARRISLCRKEITIKNPTRIISIAKLTKRRWIKDNSIKYSAETMQSSQKKALKLKYFRNYNL